jgi:hypothetical protein
MPSASVGLAHKMHTGELSNLRKGGCSVFGILVNVGGVDILDSKGHLMALRSLQSQLAVTLTYMVIRKEERRQSDSPTSAQRLVSKVTDSASGGIGPDGGVTRKGFAQGARPGIRL